MPNDRVIVNPKFSNNGGFYRSLMARGVGAKDWPNTHTEVEHLGAGKFAASISVGHRVFFDKADGNKPRKHKLTDERPGKDYVLIQGAKCCVEIHPYYAKYFDVQHEEVRLHEERWVVQRLFKTTPKKIWRDVGAYNPQIAVEEYSEPAGDVVKVTVTYDTDYGTLTVEYFQRDGNALKHNVYFKNTSGGEETFRVLQRWAGIVGDKVNGKDVPVNIDEPFLAFRKTDKKLAITENLYSMVFNEDGTEKTDHRLQRPISIESHAQGMKADFIYGDWVLAQSESLEIDPDTVTLDNPTEDGYTQGISKITGADSINMEYDGDGSEFVRGYVEWDISGITAGATITDTIFKYHGWLHDAGCDSHIHAMASQPSTNNAATVYADAADGTVYADPAGFPEVGANKQVDLGASADSDLGTQLSVGWFAIGMELDSPTGDAFAFAIFYSEEKTDAPTPKPTLYVEYTAVSAPTVTTQAVSGIGFD